MKNDKLKKQLDLWYKKECTCKFINNDPVQFIHIYKNHRDIEIVAFLVAIIAWGKRSIILHSAKKMLSLMGSSPYKYIINEEYKTLKNKNIHRTFFESDLKYYCNGLKHCFKKYKNLETLFLCASAPLRDGIWNGIKLFRDEMAKANNGRYSKHISDPEKSACKRLNLALRWLVRPGPVDLGLWKKVKPCDLYIPLDVHVARVARKLRLLKRKSNDKKAVIELTENLRAFCPEDPVKYDFALFGIGVSS